MNFVDMILFHAVHSPEKIALAADQAALTYGQLAHGIISAQRKIETLGLEPGTIAGVHIAHPIDHMVLSCALHHAGIGSLPIDGLAHSKVEVPQLAMVLTDRILPPDLVKRFGATILLFDPSWFNEQTEAGLGHRVEDTSRGARIARAFVDPDDPRGQLVQLTAAQFDAQLSNYYLAALPKWDRMVTTLGVGSNSGYLLAAMALWLGRTVCFASVETARELIILHGHDYLVTSARHAEAIGRLQGEHYRSIQSIRGAFLIGPGFTEGTVAKAQRALTGNIVCGFATPACGLVAFAPASSFTGEGASGGLVAPWAEIDAGEGAGGLKVRLRPAVGADAAWEATGLTGRVRDDGMLMLGA
jgi:hypothetical protein